MNPYELAKALTGCRFGVGSYDKYFVRDIARTYGPLTLKQTRHLYRMAYRYRKQLGRLGVKVKAEWKDWEHYPSEYQKVLLLANDLDHSCGGTFGHVDEEPGKDGTVTDWYLCGGCQIWRAVTWDKKTEKILEIAESQD